MATLLIVDDDAVMRDALAEAIRDLGHEVRVAASGSSALKVLEVEQVHAAFLDLRMPGMDGLELLRRIRTREQPPVVTILTAHATASNTIEAMRMGAFDHVTKPIGRADLAALVARMLAVESAPAPAVEITPDRLVGASEDIRAVQKTIGLLADNDAT